MRLDLFDRLVKAMESIPNGKLGAVVHDTIYDQHEPPVVTLERLRHLPDVDFVMEFERAAKRHLRPSDR